VCPCSHKPPAQGAKFHSFLYTGSKTVRVNMESCYGGMSTRLKQRAVTEILTAENVTPAEIHRRLQAVYGENTVNRTTVNRWAIKIRECEPGRTLKTHLLRVFSKIIVTCSDNRQKHMAYPRLVDKIQSALMWKHV